MFLYNSFFGTLPDNSNDFKKEINALFPHIHDTKHLLNTRMSVRKYLPSQFKLGTVFDHFI